MKNKFLTRNILIFLLPRILAALIAGVLVVHYEQFVSARESSTSTAPEIVATSTPDGQKSRDNTRDQTE